MAGATDVRAMAFKLCEDYLPETRQVNDYAHWGQIGFNNIAKDYGAGSGTTCGFLPHWLLWRLGCRDNTLVNRSEPAEGLSYLIGNNISILQPLGKRHRPAWMSLDEPATSKERTERMASGQGGPQRGDFVVIRGRHWKNKTDGKRTLDSSHIFVLLNVEEADGRKVRWRVAQCGATTHAGQQAGHITTITGTVREDAPYGADTRTHPGPSLVFTTNIIGEEADFPRRVMGYNDLSKVSRGSVPERSFVRLFDDRRSEPADNTPG